jgi:hypothetical protein
VAIVIIQKRGDNMEQIIPLDFSVLDVRFLPYYLTAERVEVEWNFGYPEDAPDYTKFYVGFEFHQGYVADNDEVLEHFVTFTALRNKNQKWGGYQIADDIISTVQGLGVRNPCIPPKWPMSEVVRYKLRDFENLRKLRSAPWINRQPVYEAISDFAERLDKEE